MNIKDVWFYVLGVALLISVAGGLMLGATVARLNARLLEATERAGDAMVEKQVEVNRLKERLRDLEEELRDTKRNLRSAR